MAIDRQLRHAGTEVNELLRQVDDVNVDTASAQPTTASTTRYVLAQLQNHMEQLTRMRQTTEHIGVQMAGVNEAIGAHINATQGTMGHRPY